MFATVEDLEKRWRPLSDDESARAEVLLEDAAVMVVSVAGEDVDPAAAKIAVCGMVKRSMNGPAGAEGVASAQQAAGPFSQSLTYSNPTGALYVSKAEKKLLGVKQRAFSIDMAGG